MKARLETLEAQHDEAAGVDTEEQVRLLMRAEQVRTARCAPPPRRRAAAPRRQRAALVQKASVAWRAPRRARPLVQALASARWRLR